MLMFRLIWVAGIHTRYFLRRYMPTNILLDAIRTRRGLKWGCPGDAAGRPLPVGSSPVGGATHQCRSD